MIWTFTNAAWCIVDFSKGIYPQSVLFFIYFILSIWGIIEWTKRPEGKNKLQILEGSGMKIWQFISFAVNVLSCALYSFYIEKTYISDEWFIAGLIVGNALITVTTWTIVILFRGMRNADPITLLHEFARRKARPKKAE